MSPFLYFPVFILTVTALCFFTGLRYINSPNYDVQEKGNNDMVFPFLLCVIYAIFLGSRPMFFLFGDTVNYGREYLRLEPGIINMNWHSEWIWQWIMHTCKALGLSMNMFFTVIDLGYFITVLWAVKRFTPDNILLGMLFVLGSLMFYTFGINGIRNGLACHIVLLGLSFIFTGNYPVGITLLAISFGIHRSVILPIVCCCAALFVIKKVKVAVYIWFGAIVLSLFAGDWFTNFFASLGFDDRMTQYTESQDYSRFSRVGFRWDFLLYSAMPVYMAWEVCVKRKISDNWYNALCVIYILCNAFWVLVIRATYSNRFAYLSWFMYPIIIAYPLIMLPVWEDQDRKIGMILYAYIAFTILMNILWHNF